MDPALPLRGTHVTFPESYPFGNVRGTRVMNTRNNILSCGSAVIALLLASTATAQTNFSLVETFDQYADQTAFEAVWQPDNGNGNTPLTTSTGILVPNLEAGLIAPNDDPPNIQGKAVNVFNQINEYVGPATAEMATLFPTATQNVRFSVDIFADGLGNKALTAGLRNKTTPSNIFELGLLNFSPPDTNTPATGFAAFRAVLLGGGGPSPSWQYFELDPALDRPDDTDEIVNVSDIGANHWHRWTADIGLAETTFTLDLYRDGLTNSEATPDVGVTGVDASVTLPISLFSTNGLTPDPFNSLRIGRPSGGTGSVNEAVVDNVSLQLIDLVAGSDNADFSENSIVDGADFLIWQQNLGTPDPLQTDGDANADDAVNGTDLSIWNTQYGAAPPAVASLNAVPEPSSAVLSLLLGTIGFAIRRRQ